MRGRLLDSLEGWAATSCPIPCTRVPAQHVLSNLACWCPWASMSELYGSCLAAAQVYKIQAAARAGGRLWRR